MLGPYRPGSEGNLASNLENPDEVVKNQEVNPDPNGQPESVPDPAAGGDGSPAKSETPKAEAPVRTRQPRGEPKAEPKAEAKAAEPKPAAVVAPPASAAPDEAK